MYLKLKENIDLKQRMKRKKKHLGCKGNIIRIGTNVCSLLFFLMKSHLSSTC